jgi:HlyD family secretion protein
MTGKNIIIATSIVAALGIGGYSIYKIFFAPKTIQLYRTQKIERRSISQSIKATGYLFAEDTYKVCSLITGIVEKMIAEENDVVKKGQIIALVDDGKGDTEVREAKASLDSAQENFSYAHAFYKRQKALYDEKLLSQDAFEKITRDYKVAHADLELKKTTYEKTKMLYERKKILSPVDGVIISKVASEGESVLISSPTVVMYVIAKDLTKMEAKLDVDENVIGSLHLNMQALLTFDAYPNQQFTCTITEISNAPISRRGAVSYLATAPVENKKLLFRPGMSVTALITISDKENVLAVPGHIFKLNVSILKEIAKALNFQVKELDKKTRRDLSVRGNMKWLWVKEGSSFVEKPVEIGVNDNAYFEIVSGLNGTEELIVDVAEPDVMKEFFERFFGKGLKE